MGNGPLARRGRLEWEGKIRGCGGDQGICVWHSQRSNLNDKNE